MIARKTKKNNKKSNIAIKYCALPNEEQSIFFAKSFGCKRKIWNLMLDEKCKNYKETKHFDSHTPAYYKKKEEYSYLKEVDSLALANVQMDLEAAFIACFDKKRKKRNKFPKYKKKGKCRYSYTTNNQNGTIEIGKNHIKLPKVGNVKAVIHRKPEDNWHIKSATISMEKDGKYYISVLFVYENTVSPLTYTKNDLESRTIGFDYKSDGLYIDDKGDCADMPKFYQKAQKKRGKLQKNMSRKLQSHIIGYNGNKPIYDKDLSECKNYQKDKKKHAKMERHVSNQRKDFLQKKSTEITNLYDFVCIEDLDMKAMSNKGFGNGKATMNNGYGMFTYMLKYKLERKGGQLVIIDKWYPSSQICNCCGFQNPEVKDLRIREWTCPNCGEEHDRDTNAAKNIKHEGIRMLLNEITLDTVG